MYPLVNPTFAILFFDVINSAGSQITTRLRRQECTINNAALQGLAEQRVRERQSVLKRQAV